MTVFLFLKLRVIYKIFSYSNKTHRKCTVPKQTEKEKANKQKKDYLVLTYLSYLLSQVLLAK